MGLFSARSVEASRLRRRKYELVREFGLPESLLRGRLAASERRCGKANCRCAKGRGHGRWTLTWVVGGKRHVEHISREWLDDLQREAAATRAFLAAVEEVMAINGELLHMTRLERRKKVRRRAKKRRRA